MIQIRIASSSGAQSQRISRRLDQPRWVTWHARASSWCWSSQRARNSQSLTLGKAGRRTRSRDRQSDGSTVYCVYICVSKHDLFSWSAGQADAPARMPPSSASSDAQVGGTAGRVPHALTAGYDRPDVEMFQNTPLFPSVSGEEVVERSSEDAVEWNFLTLE